MTAIKSGLSLELLIDGELITIYKVLPDIIKIKEETE